MHLIYSVAFRAFASLIHPKPTHNTGMMHRLNPSHTSPPTAEWLVFALFVLGSGWLGVGIDHLLPEQPAGNTLGMGVWLILPFLFVLFLLIARKDLRNAIGWKIKWNSQKQAYIIALCVFPLVTAFTLGIGYLTKTIDFRSFSGSVYVHTFYLALLPGILKNFFEEILWRGYLVQRWLGRFQNDLWIYLLGGLLWGLWHLPYYLYFLPEETIKAVWDTELWLFCWVAVLTMMAWTVLFVEMYRWSGTLWTVVLMHTIEDAVLNPLLIDQHIQIAPHAILLVSPISGLIPTLCYLAIGLFLRHSRLKSPPSRLLNTSSTNPTYHQP
jgi:membrane protease YdiL (CAAX protease family)